MATSRGTDCGYQHKKTPPDVADRYIAKAGRICAESVEQKALCAAKSWLGRKDAAEYAAYRRSLGRR